MKGIRWCSCRQQRQHKHHDSPGRFSVFQMCTYTLCVGGGVVGMHIHALQLCWKLNESSSPLMLSFRKGNILPVAETGLLSTPHSLEISTRFSCDRVPCNPCSDLPVWSGHILSWCDTVLPRYAGKGLKVSFWIKTKLKFLSNCHNYV